MLMPGIGVVNRANCCQDFSSDWVWAQGGIGTDESIESNPFLLTPSFKAKQCDRTLKKVSRLLTKKPRNPKI